MSKIYTFWEGEMPGYIKLCLKTWKFDYVLLNYDNVLGYTYFDLEKAKKFTLAQISDIIRVHVLRDNGGIWMDADTIMVGDSLPKDNMVGIPEERAAHCGYLNFEKNSHMMTMWAKDQDAKISLGINTGWDLFANSFSDIYIKTHPRVSICSREPMFPELYNTGCGTAKERYQQFYFTMNLGVDSLKPTEMLMLHNSWTPSWYKELSEEEALCRMCTLSNILREVTR